MLFAIWRTQISVVVFPEVSDYCLVECVEDSGEEKFIPDDYDFRQYACLGRQTGSNAGSSRNFLGVDLTENDETENRVTDYDDDYR